MALMPLAPGMPQWMGWLSGAVAAIAAVTDYRTGKIYNWLTLPALLAGLVVAVANGVPTMVAALQGVGVAGLIFLPMFFTGILGGGDVKLLLALGTILGAQGIFLLSLVTILIAGAGAVALLFKHRRAGIFVNQLAMFFRSVFTPGLALQWPKLNRDIKAPFGIAIFFGLLYILAGGRG
ncbi:MAG: prepilin peptidase [Deltaproteobacteria bacterium]|nr:prepilin peptidase [Deltaproteobacteria bacterium]